MMGLTFASKKAAKEALAAERGEAEHLQRRDLAFLAQQTVDEARAQYNRTNRIAALREREIDAFIKAATTSLRNSVKERQS